MTASRIAPARPVGSPGDAPSVSHSGDASALLKRAEVRDVLAWLRLLVDPQDAAAVARVLARPPIELRQVELARVIQVARRRKGNLVMGLAAATESPSVPPEARERIQRFVELHRSATAELDAVEPDVFIGRLIERLGARGRALLAPEDATEQRASLERLHGLAIDFMHSTPLASTRDLARHLTTVAPDSRSKRLAAGDPPVRAGKPLAVSEATGAGGDANADLKARAADGELRSTFQALRQEVLDGAARIGGRLGELRLDTDLDIAHGIVRYLELLKVSALLQRPDEESFADALADVNARLLAAITPLQREILQTSTLDEALIAREGDVRAGDDASWAGDEVGVKKTIVPREQHSLGPFLPHKGIGLALSASDIQTYRTCPMRYKFARVLRIPTEQTVHQRFGIVVHQTLERYHRQGGATLAQLLELLDACARRAGFREREPGERFLLEKAREALSRYHQRMLSQRSQPVWFERQFQFRLGPHHVRGRVDRVDRLAASDESDYELIDYKTSRPKSPEQLRDDIQLSLYALAAREDWRLDCTRQAYYYVLDDLSVPVSADARDVTVEDVVLEAGEGILAQEFEPTPSHAVCSTCDYRIACPAAAT